MKRGAKTWAFYLTILAAAGVTVSLFGRSEFAVALIVATGAAVPVVFASTACPHDDFWIKLAAGAVAIAVLASQHAAHVVRPGAAAGAEPGA